MPQPRVRVRRLAPKLTDWYYVSARYPTALMARKAWEKVERRTPRGSLGIYRHGPTNDPGVLVSAVSLKRDEVDRCARLLRDGLDELLPFELVDSMILRRARIVVAAADESDAARRIKIRRPEDRGDVLDQEGFMHQPKPGQG